ncbi:hypothetical protein [Sphingobium sp. DC-2]|uniref:hypothetical protein n=1 Tax=Sphingobium sp. DC-2 TaxID=1303256 RepID=UPI0004C2C948|nr:hypothetical protein [Sphingobium sp. DC-2]
MTAEERYRLATVEAERKKAAFLSSAAEAKARVSPARIKQDVKQKAGESLHNASAQAMAKANEHPVATAAGAGAFVLYLFRRPLAALFRRTYVRLSNRTPDQSEKDDG